ncbi:hypothetical protein [Sodalinema gerasimenkoae]|jgi:hypothetical protein|uniref:hypothetical protein n=1 Tax=Sodalinema gerasimenkoae TaxID=2862348 RepID=UPI0013596ECA|nr:hypothetical protein [Sodalinema gerasimenkoae]
MKCPICESQNPDSSETCSVCGYDLTPYPSVLGQIPETFLEKERQRVAAAKRVWETVQRQVAAAEQQWEQAQAQVTAAEAKQAQLEAQLRQFKAQESRKSQGGDS